MITNHIHAIVSQSEVYFSVQLAPFRHYLNESDLNQDFLCAPFRFVSYTVTFLALCQYAYIETNDSRYSHINIQKHAYTNFLRSYRFVTKLYVWCLQILSIITLLALRCSHCAVLQMVNLRDCLVALAVSMIGLGYQLSPAYTSPISSTCAATMAPPSYQQNVLIIK